jgi:hypothetical protein
VGQDMQLCFWDLTEDVLKEKPPAQHGRSRLTSLMNSGGGNVASSSLPQVVIHQNHDYSTSSGVGSSDDRTTLSSLNTVSGSVSAGSGFKSYGNNNNNHHHHLSTASSIVSTAKNLFSSKHSEKVSGSGDKTLK